MHVSPQSPRLFDLYNFYRVLIGILLLGMTFAQPLLLKETRHPDWFQLITLSYLLFNLCVLGLHRFGYVSTPRQIFSSISIDILILHALFYCGNGIESGLSNLVVITVAAGNIIIRGRIGLSFAAMASILSIFIEIERVFQGPIITGNIPRAGLMGSVYFATAYILQNLALRLSQSESLALQRQQDIIDLQKLNHQIIQSMRTGIIVCDEAYRIKTMNQACLDLINLKTGEELPQQVIDRIELWRTNPSMRTTPFQVNTDKPMVQINFSKLITEHSEEILIFIEDTRLMSQQAQQLKLASLGRLTASIAHEVRNPLGAISHATQLLAESEELTPADRKMTDIIERHSKRVNLIIENTLQLSRRAEPQSIEVLLDEWLQKVIQDYQEQAVQQGDLKLEINANNARAKFDPDQIEQVLMNLINNAVRHGTANKPNAPIIIKLTQHTPDDQAYIDVIDSGKGIDKEHRLHLFEPFFTTESQGTGLGLYLSREICEANQARLDYMDKETEGTCFRVTFAHHKRII